ncbi:MAG: hypothetical protein ACRD68_16455, partial [Pyrinomonadaceae bacterium]
MRDEDKKNHNSKFIPPDSSLISKVRRALRGEVTAREAVLEAARRGRAALNRKLERAALARRSGAPHAARLRPEFARMSGAALL